MKGCTPAANKSGNDGTKNGADEGTAAQLARLARRASFRECARPLSCPPWSAFRSEVVTTVTRQCSAHCRRPPETAQWRPTGASAKGPHTVVTLLTAPERERFLPADFAC